MSNDTQDHYEPLDARRMFGVFDAIGYSPDPIAMFRSEEDAKQWLADDAAKGDARSVCCETCVAPVDDVQGRVWNSHDPAPRDSVSDERLAVRLQHDDGEIRHDAVDTIVIVRGGEVIRIGMRHGRLEIWTRGPMAVRPLHDNAIAIERVR